MSSPQTELKVLLLEDNPGDAFLLKFYLSESANPVFTVSHAETLKACLDMLSESKYDIIISDMNLPDSFGVDTIKTILQKHPGNMLIVLTGLTDEEVGLETVRYGAQDFLVKGKFDGKVLISSVMFAFERFKLNSRILEENTRLDMLQQLLEVAYFELDTETMKTYLSDFSFLFTGTEKDPDGYTLEGLLDMMDNIEEMQTIMQKSKTETVRGEFITARRSDGRKFKVNYMSAGNKLCGVLRNID
jgi:DNA-binding response OmpR family regulator